MRHESRPCAKGGARADRYLDMQFRQAQSLLLLWKRSRRASVGRRVTLGHLDLSLVIPQESAILAMINWHAAHSDLIGP